METTGQQLSVIRVSFHLIHYNNQRLNLNLINSKPNYNDKKKQINTFWSKCIAVMTTELEISYYFITNLPGYNKT